MSNFVYGSTGLIGNGVDVGVENDGSMKIAVQDQHTPIFDMYATVFGGTFSLTTQAEIDNTSLDIDTTSVADGDIICLQEGREFYQAKVLSGGGTNTITVDTPLDTVFTIAGANGEYGNNNLADFDGSITPVICRVSIAGLSNTFIDITRLIFHIEDTGAMDTAKFGSQSALTKGIVVRAKNGISKNIFNVKSNGEFSERAYDITYDDRAPAGTEGFRCRRTFAGQEKNGVTIRLDSTIDDELQIIIQDDLTGITGGFFVTVQGHVATESA